MKNRIKKLRKSRKITQSTLGTIVGLSSVQIGYLERGERRLSDRWIEPIANALKVQPWELLYNPKEVMPKTVYQQVSEINKTMLLHCVQDTLKFFKQNQVKIDKSPELFVSFVMDLYQYMQKQEENTGIDTKQYLQTLKEQRYA